MPHAAGRPQQGGELHHRTGNSPEARGEQPQQPAAGPADVA